MDSDGAALMRRPTAFLTAPDGGWLHEQFALSYGEGVYYSFPVTFLGSIPLKRSLRSVEFPSRNKVVQEAIALVREAAKTRQAIDREVPMIVHEFLDECQMPDIQLQDIVLSISTSGIVLATGEEEEVISHHKMTTISFAAGGDFEDYDVVAYVAKTRRGHRKCFVFDCGQFSNQVLATIGQAFVTAGEELDAALGDEYNLDEEFVQYAEGGGEWDDFDMTEREYEDVYGSAYQDSSLSRGGSTGGYAEVPDAPPVNHEYESVEGGGLYNNQTYERVPPGLKEANSAYHSFTARDESGGLIEANANYHEFTGSPRGDTIYDNTGQHDPYDVANMRNALPDHNYSLAEKKGRKPSERTYARASNEPEYSKAALIVGDAGPNAHYSAADMLFPPEETYANAQVVLGEDGADKQRPRSSFRRFLGLDKHDKRKAENMVQQAAEQDEWVEKAKMGPKAKDTGYMDDKYLEQSSSNYIKQKGQYIDGEYLETRGTEQDGSNGVDDEDAVELYASPGHLQREMTQDEIRGIAHGCSREASKWYTPITKEDSTRKKKNKEKKDKKEKKEKKEKKTSPKKKKGKDSSDSGNSSKSHLNPPSLPPRQSKTDLILDHQIMGSVRASPLKDKGDLLVRKLNAKAGTLTIGKEKQRPQMPTWTYIDPSKLAAAKD